MNEHDTMAGKIRQTREPVKECPVCGEKPKTKVSFKGRSTHRIRRKTQTCTCGWSKIIPTEREAKIELGLIED